MRLTQKNGVFRLLLKPAVLLIFGLNVVAASADQSTEEDAPRLIDSAIVSQEQAHKTQYDGSVFYTYFMGDSVGTVDTITGVAVLNPGKEIHPPHAHANEEYLMILEGTGEWNLNGKISKANTGDLLYAAPWDLHGILNTGETPLKFVVFRWNSKGLPVPPSPSE